MRRQAALAIALTDDSAIAAATMIGESNIPKNREATCTDDCGEIALEQRDDGAGWCPRDRLAASAFGAAGLDQA
jgi:hypothetical protein